jgi:hypothetical protein
MPIQKIKSGRVITLPVENFVGSKGEIFFDEDTGILRLGDGVTPGGHILNYGGGTGTYILVTATTTRLGGIKIGSGLVTAGDGTVSAVATSTYVLTTASNTILGGIKVGSGLTIDGYSGILSTSFDGNYNSLTNLPTIPTDINQLTDSNGLLHPGLEISQIELNGDITHSYSNINAIRFDTDSGFDVTDLGGGAVKVGMNSTFKTWKVNGQDDLVAQGLDTIEFIAGVGIDISTDPLANPKSITFTATSTYALTTASSTVLGGIKVGNNLSITPDGTLNANTTTGTANAFRTIKVEGQTDIVASSEDTVEFVGGNGITIHTDPGAAPNKTVTFYANMSPNLDGGFPDTFYGGVLAMDGGGP